VAIEEHVHCRDEQASLDHRLRSASFPAALRIQHPHVCIPFCAFHSSPSSPPQADIPILRMVRYYSATIFKSIGFDNPTATGLIIASVNFLFTLIALKYVDQVGRRKIMIFSAPGMVISLVLAAISFHCTSGHVSFLLYLLLL
jgi:MFS family permease